MEQNKRLEYWLPAAVHERFAASLWAGGLGQAAVRHCLDNPAIVPMVASVSSFVCLVF